MRPRLIAEDAHPASWEVVRFEARGLSGIRLPERFRETLTFIRPGELSQAGWYFTTDEELADALVTTLTDDPDELRLAILRRLAGEERYAEAEQLVEAVGSLPFAERARDVLTVGVGDGDEGD